jgi:hypothetical protein
MWLVDNASKLMGFFSFKNIQMYIAVAVLAIIAFMGLTIYTMKVDMASKDNVIQSKQTTIDGQKATIATQQKSIDDLTAINKDNVKKLNDKDNIIATQNASAVRLDALAAKINTSKASLNADADAVKFKPCASTNGEPAVDYTYLQPQENQELMNLGSQYP